jgi:hypothetical protein
MWLIPFTLGNKHTLSVSLPAPVGIGALVLHNYNKSLEDSFRGVQVGAKPAPDGLRHTAVSFPPHPST